MSNLDWSLWNLCDGPDGKVNVSSADTSIGIYSIEGKIDMKPKMYDLFFMRPHEGPEQIPVKWPGSSRAQLLNIKIEAEKHFLEHFSKELKVAQ